MAKGKSRGRKSWPPIKAAFLEAYRDQWEEARRVKKTPAFYDRLTAAFLARFGYDLGLYIDPENETEEWAIPLVEDERIPGLGGLVEEESKARVTWFESLRTKLSLWCNHHFRKINDNAFRDETAALFRQIARAECDNFRRKPAYQVYQTMYYKDRVLPTFNERWAAAVADAKANDEPNPSMMAIRQKVVQECWDQETAEIKEEVHMAVQLDQERRKEEMKTDLSPPKTPEEYQDRLEYCAPFIKAIAEGLRERTGLAVSILLAGPIPKNDGEIGLRSYHAGSTNDVLPRDWPRFDSVGFGKVEESILSFASHLYPPRERQRRSLAASGDPSRDGSPVAESDRSSTPASNESQGRGPARSRRQAAPGPSVLPTPTPSRSPPPPSPSPPSPSPPSPSPPSPSPPAPLLPSPPPSNIPTEPRSEATSSSPPLAPRAPLAVGDASASAVQAEAAVLPLSILVDGGCPAHLVELYKGLITAQFDINWTACTAAFARLQAKLGFQDPKGVHLPLALRPEEYPVWFKYRRQSVGPSIQSYGSFLRRLGAWWWSMQPASRGDDGQLRSSAAADWSKILTPGQNGIYLVLCGLLWVGNAIFKAKEQSLLTDWSALVDDVTWVLQRDLDVPDTVDGNASSRKRLGNSSPARPRKRARV